MAAAFKTFFAEVNSSFIRMLFLPSSSIALLEALNSTGSVTSWNNTTAENSIIPISVRVGSPNIKPKKNNP